ncbi:hypothetical protein RRF57_000848 [Xylaria bambusicola]|uniref:Cellulase n=1 Tax=Xylaria bambusicola TaxID=326684 RepID=A0AAN7Z129_9PEZI
MFTKAVLGLVAAAVTLTAPAHAASGNGVTTRYWDCCKPSCAWSGKAAVSSPAQTCDANDNPLSNVNAKSGCDGGVAYTCSDYSPWAVNDNLAYGFAATAISGGTESSWCCACYQYVSLTPIHPLLSTTKQSTSTTPSHANTNNPTRLEFTSGPVAGKKMIVQSTNTGGDLGNNHFDILMPGGGVGLFDGCTAQFGQALPGQQYGGVSRRSECDSASMPEGLRAGCRWRFDWFQNADNPSVRFAQVSCPAELTAISGCKRNDDGSFGPPSV